MWSRVPVRRPVAEFWTNQARKGALADNNITGIMVVKVNCDKNVNNPFKNIKRLKGLSLERNCYYKKTDLMIEFMFIHLKIIFHFEASYNRQTVSEIEIVLIFST